MHIAPEMKFLQKELAIEVLGIRSVLMRYFGYLTCRFLAINLLSSKTMTLCYIWQEETSVIELSPENFVLVPEGSNCSVGHDI